jgi:LacI family transcriptional regulator
MQKKRSGLVMLGWNDPAVLRVIARFARDTGWHIESRIFYTEQVPEGWRGDGMLVSSGTREDVRRFICRQAPRQPTVVIGGNSLGFAAPSVQGDDREAGRLAARHFIERNHRHFAWFSPLAGRVVDDRREGFCEELAKAGFPCSLLEYRSASASPHDWSRRRRWLARHLGKLPRPLALFALDDQLAQEAIEVCVEQGWQIPTEISIMGVGNLPLACECSFVPISSIDVREEEVALRAAQLLEALMSGAPAPAAPIVLPPRGIVVRQSSDTLAVRGDALQQAIRFMQANLARPIGVEAIAEAAGISRRLLYDLFQAELARSPARLLEEFRLEHACRQLRETKDDIPAIAKASGFGTRRTFDRSFLRLKNLSPAAWRRQHAIGPEGPRV